VTRFEVARAELFTITAEGRAVAAITTLPTGRTGQLLALAILCLVLGGIYLLLVSPILDLYSQREATLTDRRMLAPRLSAAAAELPELRARLAELQVAATTRDIVIDGASDAIAAANLQSRIEELASSAGVTIGSTEGLAAENRGGYRRIGLRLAISGDYDGIIKLLAAIETTAPPLVLSNVQFHGVLRPTAQAQSSRLDAGFEVYGFRRTDAPVVVKQ
jgi:general secretion pathway protein M